MSEILEEIEDEQERKSHGSLSLYERNSDFLNKEISFLLDNLRKVKVLLKPQNRKQLTMGSMRTRSCHSRISETSRSVNLPFQDVM